ncbi:MAG TPA: hypothetical protein VE977_13745 [Pyrinomonadaceae bacterium]|nr:hypothetical protein [Pyrinomonadaceae bacterium]
MSTFKFSKGDIVIQNNERMGLKDTPGIIETNGWNAYPEPMFSGYWFPLYHVTNLQPSVLNGQDIHEDSLRLATESEKEELLLHSGNPQHAFDGHPFGFK